MDPVYLAAAAAGGVALLLILVIGRRRTSGARQSKAAHNEAQKRSPPVELGETVEFGVTDLTDHHSGERVAVGKVEGFVIFTEDIPNSIGKGDVIRAKVLSFNEGRTSADATFVTEL